MTGSSTSTSPPPADSGTGPRSRYGSSPDAPRRMTRSTSTWERQCGSRSTGRTTTSSTATSSASPQPSSPRSNRTAYHRLAFVTPSKRIVAEASAGRLPNPKHYARRAYRGEGGTQAPAPRPSELMKVRDRILHARELSLNEPQSNVAMTVGGAAAVADRLGARFPRVKSGLLVTVAFLSLAFTLFIGLGLIVLVLDLILGDWLVAHVAFWDELVGVAENI